MDNVSTSPSRPARSITCGCRSRPSRSARSGTHNTLGLAKAKRRALPAGLTSEVYGDPLEHPQPEDYWGNVNPIGLRGVYDEAKRFAEAMTMAYHRSSRVRHAHRPHLQHLRPAHAARTTAARVPNFMCQALRAKPLTVFGDGSQTRSFCYVTDLVGGLLALRSGEHEPVNIGNPAEITLGELAETVRPPA